MEIKLYKQIFFNRYRIHNSVILVNAMSKEQNEVVIDKCTFLSIIWTISGIKVTINHHNVGFPSVLLLNVLESLSPQQP